MTDLVFDLFFHQDSVGMFDQNLLIVAPLYITKTYPGHWHQMFWALTGAWTVWHHFCVIWGKQSTKKRKNLSYKITKDGHHFWIFEFSYIFILPASVCVLSRYSSFLQQSKDMHRVSLIGDSKFTVGVNESVKGWQCVSPATDFFCLLSRV